MIRFNAVIGSLILLRRHVISATTITLSIICTTLQEHVKIVFSFFALTGEHYHPSLYLFLNGTNLKFCILILENPFDTLTFT